MFLAANTLPLVKQSVKRVVMATADINRRPIRPPIINLHNLISKQA